LVQFFDSRRWDFFITTPTLNPTISNYIDALETPEGRFRTLGEAESLRDARGRVRFFSGNSGAVFPLADGRMLKCYTRLPRHAEEVYGYLARVDDTLLLPCRLLRGEIFVHDFSGDGGFFDLVEAGWADGITLETALRRASREGGFAELSAEFDRLALELLTREWAHGDLKPDNIILRDDGSMCLVDYDAMWLPALAGERTSELGTPQYQHIKRDEDFFCKAIDDFSVALISVSLRALALAPELYARHNHGDNIILYPDGGMALDEVLSVFSEHGQWHSMRLAEALRSPVPQIDGLREMLAASAADTVSSLNFSDGVAPMSSLGEWKIIDNQGVIRAVLKDYDMVKPFSEGLAAARRDGLWGFIDAGGNTVIEPQFEIVNAMHEGLAAVKTGGKFGFVDASGAMAIPAEWDYATSFRAGRATVIRDNEETVIEK
jgi:hypothetical protein